MKTQINIAELLKDCPKGMELYSPLCGKCVFDRLNFGTIICKKQNTQEITFTSKGYYMLPVFDDCECMIFPSKDQRDWSKFEPPCKFKDGDVCYVKTKALFEYIFIFKVSENYDCTSNYVTLSEYDLYTDIFSVCGTDSIKEIRLATEEEKAKLFDAIKSHGYKWNADTKTLERLIEPKFKVGDEIVKRNSINSSWIVSSVSSEYYGLKSPNGSECIGVMSIAEQDEYELVQTKFDFTTLKPFKSEVLVRNYKSEYWKPAIFGFTEKDKNDPSYVVVGGNFYYKCIPYEGNEHLLGTTDDCEEFYKNWKE